MELKYFALVCVGLLFLGCTPISYDLSIEGIIDIVEADKDYNDFKKVVPVFEPEIANITKLSSSDYGAVKTGWGDEMQSIVPFIDELELTDSTYLVELSNKADDKNDLVAVIDFKMKKSLLIVHTMSLEVGVGN